MGGHIAATLGLIVGLGLTVYKTFKTWQVGGDVPDAFQSCFTGWSFARDNWRPRRMVFTIPAAVGGTATLVAIKTGYNGWTPKGWNV